MNRSKSLAEKISSRLEPDPDVIEFTSLLNTCHSNLRFDNKDELAQYLSEGALLNVSVIGSKALSVPCGEYMVWLTNSGNTMLVPTSGPKSKEVFEHSRDQYEVLTRDLLMNWNKLEKTISEDYHSNQEDNQSNLRHGEEGNENHEDNLQNGEDGNENSEFPSSIQVSTVDRTPILRSMQDRGYSVTSLAAEVGVDPPAISRILRTPKDTQGDPGGRNPSMELASKICGALRMDPTAAFPDIFGNRKYE